MSLLLCGLYSQNHICFLLVLIIFSFSRDPKYISLFSPSSCHLLSSIASSKQNSPAPPILSLGVFCACFSPTSCPIPSLTPPPSSGVSLYLLVSTLPCCSPLASAFYIMDCSLTYFCFLASFAVCTFNLSMQSYIIIII